KGKPSVNGLFSFNYACNFTENWALQLSLEAFYSSITATSPYIKEATSQEFESDGRLMDIDFISELSGLHEKSEMLHLQALIAARYQIQITECIGYYATLGIKIGDGLWGRYTAKADKLTLTGKSESFKQLFENIERHNFKTIDNVIENGKQNMSHPNISLALETGVKYAINDNSSIYAGLFCDYSISNYALRKEKTPLVSFNGDYKSPGSEIFNYTGILNNTYSKKSGISRLSVGIKISYTFCFL
ncbi:MAG: hypothetical protein LBC49_03045, partial [Bacteroidales bacterium]|nr:hypothetical protein [Bacteroidales bacterium]